MSFLRWKQSVLFAGIVLAICLSAMPAASGLKDRTSKAVDSESTDEIFEESDEQADTFLDDLALGDLVKIDGKEVWIRMTPGQFHLSKATSRVKRRGRIRIVLRPRQIRALNTALGKDSGLTDVILDVNAVDFRRSRLPRERVESHFVVRPLSEFKR